MDRDDHLALRSAVQEAADCFACALRNNAAPETLLEAPKPKGSGTFPPGIRYLNTLSGGRNMPLKLAAFAIALLAPATAIAQPACLTAAQIWS